MSGNSKNEKKKDKYTAIREVLREYSSKEHPLKMKEIKEKLNARNIDIGRHAIETALEDMKVVTVENETEYLEARNMHMKKKGDVIYCQSINGRRSNYWIESPITDAELGLLVDMVLSSKILSQKESQSLAERLILFSGKELSGNLKYRYRVLKQRYIGNTDKQEKKDEPIVISEVSQKAYLIRNAIAKGKKIKFTLNVYDYHNGKIVMKPCGKKDRVCSPYDLIMSNGRYYMLGADLKTERSDYLKYKLYRVDLMSDLSITKMKAKSREEAEIKDTDDIYNFRKENPYMFVGDVKRVRFKIEKDYFTQVVDWFGEDFRVYQDYLDEDCWGIEVRVSTNSFIFWVLQYWGCTEVVETGADDRFRETVKLRLNEILQKYLESDARNKEDEYKN